MSQSVLQGSEAEHWGLSPPVRRADGPTEDVIGAGFVQRCMTEDESYCRENKLEGLSFRAVTKVRRLESLKFQWLGRRRQQLRPRRKLSRLSVAEEVPSALLALRFKSQKQQGAG